MKGFFFWLSLPFVAPQAIALRRSAPRFADAAGPREGNIGSGRRIGLLAIGDSIIAGVGARQLSRALVGQTALALTELFDVEVSWQAIGRTGINTRGLLERYGDDLPDVDADYVIVSLGVNDITSLTTLDQWRRDLARLFAALRDRYPQATILLAGIPPLAVFPLLPEPLRSVLAARGEAFEAVSKALIEDLDHVIHVPIDFDAGPGQFADDGFHPSEASYQVFGQAMAEAIAHSAPPPSDIAPDFARSSA